jgi:hypothetical protein
MALLGPDYGPFTALIKYAAQLIAAASALIYTWTPKKTPKSWEPREEDLPTWLRSAAVLIVGVGLVVLGLALHGLPTQKLIQRLEIGTAFFAVFLVVYLLATFRLTYPGITARKGKPRKMRVVGGFGLCPPARALRAKGLSLERILTMNAFDPNGVWTPGGLLAARVVIGMLFVGFLVVGSLLLAMAVMVAVGSSPP